MKTIQFKNLTPQQHVELARLLIQAQENLIAAGRIVGRAPYTDDTLRCCQEVQERLIDKLRPAYNETEGARTNPYPSVGYSI